MTTRISAGIALALLAGLSHAQNAPASAAIATQTDTEAHKRVVLGERVAGFLEEYAAASPELRKRADDAIEKSRPTGAGLSWYPGADAFARAVREMHRPAREVDPGVENVHSELDTIAAAFDLRVVPSCFAPRTEGIGDALTVSVRTLYSAFATKDFTCALEWVGPDGQVQPARRETIEAAVLRENGFTMYIRSPVSQPARWTLRARVARADDSSYEGVSPGVELSCIRDFAPRVAAVAERKLEGQPGRERLLRSLDLLQQHGLRSNACIDAERALAAAEQWTADGPPVGVPVPLEIVFTDSMTVEHWMWWVRPAKECARTIVLLAPAAEAPDAVLAGEVGASWMRLARDNDAELYASHVPLDPTLVMGLLGKIRERAKGELIVVGRGDAFGRMQAALYQKRQSMPFDAIVISTVIQGQDPGSVMPGITRLLVAPGDPATAADKSGTLTWVEGSWLPLLNEPRLPKLTADWLASRDAHK